MLLNNLGYSASLSIEKRSNQVMPLRVRHSDGLKVAPCVGGSQFRVGESFRFSRIVLRRTNTFCQPDCFELLIEFLGAVTTIGLHVSDIIRKKSGSRKVRGYLML